MSCVTNIPPKPNTSLPKFIMTTSGINSPQMAPEASWTPTNAASAEAYFNYNEPSILVVDPATRKLSIPFRAVLQTQALHRMDRVPSICMLYLQGRCRQGPMCHQLHADPAVVEMLRSEASLRTSCCPEHGEEVTQRSLSQLAPEIDGMSVDGHFVPSCRVATTTGVRRVLNERLPSPQDDKTVVQIPRSQVCRLHVLGRCRYAEDCNFVHLCRSLTDGEAVHLSNLLHSTANSTPAKSGRPAFMRATPSSAFVPLMPPSPLYAGVPATPNSFMEHQFLSLDHNDNSQETTPPSTPAMNASMSTPTVAWRHEPYRWTGLSPVRQATPVRA